MATIRILLAGFCFAAVGSSNGTGSDMLKERFTFMAAPNGGPGKSFFPTMQLQSPLKYWLGEKFYQKSLDFNKPNIASYRKLVALAQGELWVREKTGNNDGDRVEAYLMSVGLVKGQPWCAAFVSFIHKEAGYAAPRTGWSPSLFPVARLVKAAAPGNVFGIYFPALKRIAHCGFVAYQRGDMIGTIEGNTNVGGSRNGDGVYSRLRHKRTIQRYADWVK